MTSMPMLCLWRAKSIKGFRAWNSFTFKARLDKFWHNQDINFRAQQLQGTGSGSECLYEES